MKSIEDYMRLALKEANKCKSSLDVPVGVVLVKDGVVIAKAHNKKEYSHLVTAHAELLAIDKACKKLGDYRLEGVDVFVTLEPCIMCLGAMLSARVRNVYFGAYDSRFGVVDTLPHIKFNHSINLVGGVLENECSKVLSDFFKSIRK